MSSLGVAYHNVGIEEEKLKNYEGAIAWFRKAVQFMEKHAKGQQRDILLTKFQASYRAVSAIVERRRNTKKA